MARELIRIEDVHRAFGPVKVLDSCLLYTSDAADE